MSTSPYRQAEPSAARPSREAELEGQLRTLLAAVCGALAAGCPANGGGDWAAIPMDRIAALRAAISDVAAAAGLTVDERAKYFSSAMVHLDRARTLEQQLEAANKSLREAAMREAPMRERLATTVEPPRAEPALRYERQLVAYIPSKMPSYEPPPGARVVSFSVDDGRTYVFLEYARSSRTAYRG